MQKLELNPLNNPLLATFSDMCESMAPEEREKLDAQGSLSAIASLLGASQLLSNGVQANIGNIPSLHALRNEIVHGKKPVFDNYAALLMGKGDSLHTLPNYQPSIADKVEVYKPSEDSFVQVQIVNRSNESQVPVSYPIDYIHHTAKEQMMNSMIFAITANKANDYISDLTEKRSKKKNGIADAVLVRLMRSVTDKVFDMEEDQLLELLSQASDDDVFVDTISSALINNAGLPARSKAELLGAKAKKKWIEARGGCIGLNEVSELTGLSRETINKYGKNSKLLAIQVGSKTRYPLWQFEDGKIVKNLASILTELKERGYDQWSKFMFLIVENDYLKVNYPDGESTPIDALIKGHNDRVIQAAQAYMTHGSI